MASEPVQNIHIDPNCGAKDIFSDESLQSSNGEIHTVGYKKQVCLGDIFRVHIAVLLYAGKCILNHILSDELVHT